MAVRAVVGAAVGTGVVRQTHDTPLDAAGQPWSTAGCWAATAATPGANLDGRICGFLHHQGGTSAQDQHAHCTDATFSS